MALPTSPAAVAVVGYLFGNYDGRSYLEQPIYIKVGIVIVAIAAPPDPDGRDVAQVDHGR